MYTYIAKLYKESEVLEHMINRIENDLEKVDALSHPGPGNWSERMAHAAFHDSTAEWVTIDGTKYRRGDRRGGSALDLRESHQENKDD